MPRPADALTAAPTPDVRLRLAHAGDAAPLADFGRAMFIETYGHVPRPENLAHHLERTYGEPLQRAELTDPAIRVFLAEEGDGTLAGYLLLRTAVPAVAAVPAGAHEVGRCYVARRWHGRGVAARLMQAAIREAAAAGAPALWLTVWEHAVWAQRFYGKMGFQVVGTMPFHMGDESQQDFVMLRELQAADRAPSAS